jgi:hypothetical protein
MILTSVRLCEVSNLARCVRSEVSPCMVSPTGQSNATRGYVIAGVTSGDCGPFAINPDAEQALAYSIFNT